MASTQIDERRVQVLNDTDPKPDRAHVLYWMQHSQRSEHNDALEYAVQRANDHGVPLLVAFGLTEDYPDANERHFRFMLEGLQQTAQAISRRNIGFTLRFGSPPDVCRELATDAVEVVTDRGYLRHHRQWRENVASGIDVRLTQIEADLVVPVETASNKREYAARTIRSDIEEVVDDFLRPLATTAVNEHFSGDAGGESLDDLDAILGEMNIDRSVQPVDWIRGGTNAAKARLNEFLEKDLTGYDDARQDVCAAQVSFLSPYLHLGMISPVEVALRVREARQRRTDDIDSYLEELLVRRELTHNFCFYSRDDYDQFGCLPDWASETLESHKDDSREKVYTAEEIENAETEDAVWNAAMMEVKHRGYLHNQLRMYWGKKFLEYTNTPAYAYRTLLDLNNKYFLDGRDANSYANVGWIFGLHDRAHQERSIYGKVRYLSRDGLNRKFDVETYVRQIKDRYGDVRGEL